MGFNAFTVIYNIKLPNIHGLDKHVLILGEQLHNLGGTIFSEPPEGVLQIAKKEAAFPVNRYAYMRSEACMVGKVQSLMKD